MASPSLTSGAAIRLRIAAAMRYRRSYLVVLLFALAVTQCCCAGQQSSSSSPFPALLNAPPLPQLAPLLSAPRPIASLDSSNSTHTRYRYIVVLSPTISPANLSSVIDGILPANASVHKLLIGPPPSLSLGLSVNPSFNAFSAYLSPAQLAAVRASPLVSYVEQDGLISLDLDVDLVHIDALSHHSGSGQASIAQVDNSNPLYSWGLDRIVSTAPLSTAHVCGLICDEVVVSDCSSCLLFLLHGRASAACPSTAATTSPSALTAAASLRT